MRTRIALVAITPIAVITASAVALTGLAPSARGASPSPSGVTTAVMPQPPASAAAYHGPATLSPVLTATRLLLDLNPALGHEAALHEAVLSGFGAPVAVAPPADPSTSTAVATPTAATSGPVDTVTPDQRAAWERVAMCEEGGNWAADGAVFSGGLGISRANWIAYGGTEFAPEGAMATEDQQIMVAERIQSSPPDQYGCQGW